MDPHDRISETLKRMGKLQEQLDGELPDETRQRLQIQLDLETRNFDARMDAWEATDLPEWNVRSERESRGTLTKLGDVVSELMDEITSGEVPRDLVEKKK